MNSVILKSLFSRGQSYRKHGRGKGERLLFLAEGLFFTAVVARVFYGTFSAVLFLLPLLYPMWKRFQRRRREKYEREINDQFKELLSSLLSSMKAGYSAENAFRGAYEDMAFLFGEKSHICKTLTRICGGLDSHVPLETLLWQFAMESGTEEIREFAEVFAIAKRSGGRMSEILLRSAALIQDRIDVEKEIRILISAKKMEQTIMDIVPFAIIVYISVTSRGFFSVLYRSPGGIILMSACLGIYLTAFIISEKIVDIKV